jgi:hypothetical protein
MKASELREMIRRVVKEEVARQLPGVLSEMYLRKMISENVGQVSSQRNTRVSNSLVEDDFDDDEIPEPMQNSDEGIYQQSVLFKEDNPFRDLYEGVSPIGSRQAQPGVPIDKIASLVKKSAHIVTEVARPKVSSDETRAKFEEQRLARYRQQLDSKVVK